MDSVKLQIDVNNIKIDPAQLKKITQMNASFDSLLKVVNSINIALGGVNTKTTTFLKNSTQLSGIYDKLAGSVKTADSAMDSVNRKAQLLRENSKLTAANFKAMGDNAAKAGKIPTPKPTAALPGTSPTGGGGSSPTAGVDPKSVVQTAFAFNQVFSAVTAATGALNQFLQPYVELDKQIKNIGTLGRTNFEEFATYASKLAAEVPGQAQDAAAAYYQIISALGTRADAFTNQEIANIGEIAAKAAVAGQTTTQVAADVGTSILNAYGMKAEDTGKVFDVLFAGIKLGKTTFEEIAGAIPNFTAAASNAGVGVDQTTAALASLTAIGIPTAQAGTQLNSVFTLLSKGNANLETALAASGLTLDDLRNQMKAPVAEGGGLVNVLQTMRTAVEATGEAFGAKFTGRVEAANLVMGLTGQNLQNATDTYAALENEVAGGAAAKAFGVAAKSIYAETDGIISTIQNQFNTLFSTMGTGAVTALNSFVQLAPAVTGLSSALAIVPVKGIFSSNFVTKTLPKALAGVLGMIPAFGGLTAAQTAAGVAGGSMWATILWPITLVVAAIAAIVGVVVLVIKYFDELKAVVFGVFSAIKAIIQGFIQNWVDTINAIKSGDLKGAVVGIFKGTVGVYYEAGKNGAAGFKEGFNESLDSNSDVIQKRIAKNFEQMDAAEVKVKATADFDNLIKSYETTVNQISELKATPNLTEEQEQQLARLEEKAQLAANAIADIAPDSISSSKSTIDENGKLIESYEVSIDKAKDFKNKQEELNKADVSEATKQYEKNATDLLGIYETQTKEVDALIKKRDELASSGDLKGAKEMEDDITEAVKKQKASKDLVIKGYKESIEIGGEELGVNKKIQSEFKITEGTVQDIKNAQQGVNEELTSSAKLATLFGEGMSAAKTAQDEQAAALAALIKQRNEGNAEVGGVEIQKLINDQLGKTIDAKKTLSEFDKAKAEADKLAGLGAKATTKQTKSLYDNLQKVYDAEVSRLELQQQSNALESESIRLVEGRESNAIDDLALKAQENNKLLEQKKILIDLYKISADGTGVGVNLKQEDKEKVLKDYESLLLDIRKNANEQKTIELKLGIDSAKAQEVIEKQARTDLEFKIKLGLANDTDLLALIQQEGEVIANKVSDLAQKIAAKESELLNATTEEQKTSIQATILNYTNQFNELNQLYKDNRKSIIEMEVEISKNTLIEINKRLDAEKTAKQAQLDLDIETAKKRQEILNSTYSSAIADKSEKELAALESGEQKKLDAIDAAEEEKLAILENQNELGILSETLYQQRLTEIQKSAESERIAQTEAAAKKKAEAEANARTQAVIAEGLNQGVLLEASRQFEIQKTQIEADAAQKKLEALIASGTASKAEIAAAQENFNTLNGIVKDKGDLLLQYSGVIQDGISKTIGSLFAGNAEDAKNAFKEVLAVAAGALEALAQDTITTMILTQLKTTSWKAGGFGAVVALPLITAISNQAVSALIRPVTQKLLSFANGGQIDKPTMAVIGDAKNGNSSTEWVFNNKNLKQYSAMVAKDYAKSMEQKNDTANMARLVSEAYKLANSKVLIETIRKDKESNKNVSDARINELVQSNMEIKKVLLEANEQRNITNDYTNATNRLLIGKDFSSKVENNYISGSGSRRKQRRIY